MKITFLGTSHGAPAADRYCSCTVLESGGAVYLIDAAKADFPFEIGTPKDRDVLTL